MKHLSISSTELVLFFRKKILFRTLYVYAVIVLFAINAMAVALSAGTADAVRFVAGTAVMSLWLIYLYRSRRVKNTFGPGPGAR